MDKEENHAMCGTKKDWGFYKFVNDLSPEYTVDPISPLHQSQYHLRNQDIIGQLRARTDKFKSSFYPNCLSELNKLEPELRLAPSVAGFKKQLLLIICPPPKKNLCLEFTTQKDYAILPNSGLVSAN